MSKLTAEKAPRTPLSLRLQRIRDMVLPCGTAADIGCDHGFVPIELVRNGTARQAVACDVRKGPLQKAREHISEACLQERIECRIGDGLQPLKAGEADCIIIAGMGGALMTRILQDGETVLQGASELVLSPHTEPWLVRRECIRQGFRITKEEMICEEGIYYLIFRCEKTAPMKGTATADDDAEELSEDELRYGPMLLKERPPVFIDFLREEYRKNEVILGKLKGSGSTGASGRTAELLREQERLKRLCGEIRN